MKPRLFFVLHMILFIPVLCHAQWIQTNGPLGGRFNNIVVNGTVLLSGTNSYGVFKSTDNGQNWTQTSLNTVTVRSLINKDGIIFAGTEISGIYKSTDNGSSWAQTSLSQASITCIAFSSNFIFASSTSGYVYRSSDNGITWSNIFNTGQSSTCIFSTGNNIYLGYMIPYPVYRGGVYLSTNNGDNWSLVLNNDYPVFSIYGTSNSIFVATAINVLKSTNMGANWNQVLYINGSVFSIFCGLNKVFAATGNGLYVSLNDGSSWSNTGVSYDIISFLNYGNDLFAGTMENGLFFSTDAGSVWLQYGLKNKWITSFTFSDGSLFASTMGNGIYYSTNYGGSWIKTQYGNSNVYSVVKLGNYLFAGYDYGVMCSTNNGSNWINTSLFNKKINCLLVKDNRLFAAATYSSSDSGGIYMTDNLGLNWQRCGNNVNYVLTLTSLGNNIYAGTGQKGVFKSTDNGNTFYQTPLNNKAIFSLSAYNNYVYAAWYLDPGGVYRSTDYGSTWSLTSLNNVSTLSVLASGSNVVAGTHNGIRFSSDNGSSWVDRSNGMNSSTEIETLISVNNIVYAGTYSNSVYKRTLSNLMGINSNYTEIPASYKLEQNVPNPFNPTTQISYSIPKDNFVTLKVYNIIGQEVASLVNEFKKAGEHTFDFYGGNLSSGVYFYKLTAGDFSATKKMILNK